MKKIWRAYLDLFLNTFRLIEENKQTNTVQSIGKDKDGYTTIDVTPIGSNTAYQFYPHAIMEQPMLRKQMRSTDVRLIKSTLIAEGDIFIESKEYRENDEFFILQSKLDGEKWILTRDQLNANKDVLNRINKRFFSKDLFINLETHS